MKKQGTPECPADNTVLNHKPNLDIYCGEYTCASADVWAASNPLPKGYDVGTWRCANGFRGSVSTRCVQSDECGGTLQLSGCVPLQACSPPKLRGRDLCRWNFSDCEERTCSLNLLDIIRSIILQRSHVFSNLNVNYYTIFIAIFTEAAVMPFFILMLLMSLIILLSNARTSHRAAFVTFSALRPLGALAVPFALLTTWIRRQSWCLGGSSWEDWHWQSSRSELWLHNVTYI